MYANTTKIVRNALLRKPMVVADEQVFVIVVEVHTIALAVLPHLAVGALALLRPRAVAELLEAVLPHIPEVIPIDIALREVGAYRGAARNIAIHTDRGDANAGVALKGVGTNTHLVARNKAFARVRSLNTALFAALLDKLHKVGKLLIVELHRHILRGTTYGEDGE